jgi:DNA repair photolyase
VGCGVLMAPILPFLSDDEDALEETVRAISETGATHVTPIVLHLRKGGAREWWMAWLRDNRPDLVPKYRELYGDGAYAPKHFQREICDKVDALARRYRIGEASPRKARRIPGPHPEPIPRSQQLSLI